MKFDLVKDEMSMLIENMSEQFEMINKHETNIPQIELDIFMRNIQKLYENVIFLNKINQNSIVTSSLSQENKKKKVAINEEAKHDRKVETIEKKVDVAPIATETQIAVDELKEETIVEEKEIEAVNEEKEVVFETQEIVQEVIPEIETPKAEIKEIVEPEKNEEVKVEMEEKTPEPKLVEPTLSFEDILEEPPQENDLFSDVKANSEILDLNKKLAEARNTQSIVEKLQTKRIESLKTVIGINDKFYFINELFSGDSQKYEDIIYTLNNFKKLEDAMVYFSTLKYKFGWDEETEAYEKLSQMLERKFEMANA